MRTLDLHDIDPNFSVENLKALIEGKLQQRKENQKLLFQGKEMKDGTRIGDYGIKNFSLIFMNNKSFFNRPGFNLEVRDYKGQSKQYLVQPNISVKQLKQKVKIKQGIKAHDQIMVNSGQRMEDNMTLE